MMLKNNSYLDDLEINSYHKKLSLSAGGGWFIDGYVLSIIGVVLIYFAQALDLNNFWQGMIAASSIIGICLGGVLGGWLSDRYGRKKLFILSPILFIVFSILQFFAQTGEVIFFCRLMLGLAVGIEYTVGSALLTEFLPKKARGPRISSLVVMWFVGAMAAYITGYLILATLSTPDAWRYVLASPALIGIVLLIIRLNTLESPKWLISQGLTQEANHIIQHIYGSGYSIKNLMHESTMDQIAIGTLLKTGYLSRILFVSLFWACCVTPIFAVYSFAPKLLGSLNLTGDLGVYGSILITFFFVIGCVLGTLFINKMGRRKMLLHSFLWSLLALIGLGYFAEANASVILVLFAAYAIFIGGAQILTIVYPNEIFPTEVRAMAVGICTSASKVGVVMGTWMVPIAVDSIGIANTMYAAAFINLVGLVVSYFYAVETSHLSLEDAAKI